MATLPSKDKDREPQAEGNIYASKTELLEWVNGLLQLQLSRLEQFASGAVFCQLLDAYFKDAIPMGKVNYHASNEYESIGNYKVLQLGFTAINLTRDIHVSKLSRGSRVELLELLQYLYKYLLKLKAQESYNARERRAITVRGGTDAVPLPSWMSGSQAAGRSTNMNKSSGNWGLSIDPSQDVQAAAAAAGAAAAAAGAAAAAKHAEEKEDNESGVAVFRVVEKEEEAAAAMPAADDPGSTTRLVIPEDAISSRMIRPLSPGGRAQLEICLGVAAEAVGILGKTCASMTQICSSLPSCASDSYVYRGKIKSLEDASATTAGHVQLLLDDVAAVCSSKAAGSADDVKVQAEKLQKTRCLAVSQELSQVQDQLGSSTQLLQAATAARQLTGQQQLNLQLTQLQKQLASTAALDGCLRSVGAAYAALMGRAHKEGAALAAQFLVDASGGPGVVTSKVLKLGDCSMKQLRNGDVYKGRYQGSRKNGEGSYFFINADVYEGQFRDDRMAGSGVYSFSPEGRYEGDWCAAVYEGHGSETFAKGSTYHGQYGAGLRHGWGCCRFFNGDFYEGQWAKGLREGCGMQQCTDDSNYVGDYRRGKRHGYGVYSFPNGDQYLGEYEDDIPQGYGVYVFGSGQRYEGHWEKGKKHGWSIYTVETGQRWAGSWVEGKPQWVHPLPQEAGADVAEPTPEVADNLSHAQAACKNAQEACALAQAKLQGHWAAKGEVQQGLAAATAGAAKAAADAQAARQHAQLLAARLDAAAALVDDGSRSAQIKLVAHALTAHQLTDVSAD
ncbi:hypothetical protein OEZ86_013695 [Tetradesmus obliquus]|nr:hypothetical protein OEZ86_013695 [Tetradesmus obliquus]